MKLIELTRGQFATVDEADFKYLREFNWYAVKPRKTSSFYAARRKGRTLQTMHRLILGAKAGEFVDHIDGDGLNNRRSNLRIATRGENQRNTRVQKRNRTGYKGVSFRSRSPKTPYEVNIFKEGKAFYLGLFTTAEEAARIYNVAARYLFGKFAKLNTIKKVEKK